MIDKPGPMLIPGVMMNGIIFTLRKL